MLAFIKQSQFCDHLWTLDLTEELDIRKKIKEINGLYGIGVPLTARACILSFGRYFRIIFFTLAAQGMLI